jgi:apolipoprotein N-acyltransferase
LICYEIAFASEVSDYKQRPDWILTVTNDAWFGPSIGPHQHLFKARMRAVELGLPVVRVANTGISAIIDFKGRVIAKIPLEQTGILQTNLPDRRTETLFASVGNGLFGAIWLFLLIIQIFLRRKV